MSIARVMDCPSMVRVLLQQINVLTYDNIYYTHSHTILQLQTDILSSILSDREFDSSPFIQILVFRDVFYSKLEHWDVCWKYLNVTLNEWIWWAGDTFMLVERIDGGNEHGCIFSQIAQCMTFISVPVLPMFFTDLFCVTIQ